MPAIPSEDKTLTIIKVCALIVATDKRCGRTVGRSTRKVSTASTASVEVGSCMPLLIRRWISGGSSRRAWSFPRALRLDDGRVIAIHPVERGVNDFLRTLRSGAFYNLLELRPRSHRQHLEFFHRISPC